MAEVEAPSASQRGPQLDSTAPSEPKRESPAGTSLQLALQGQLRAAVTPTTENVPWVSDVDVPRIRTKIKALLGSSELAVQINTSPDKLEWVDLYADVPLGEAFRMRLGQHKIAFGLYRQQSNFDLVFTDWSPTTRFFGAERQLGITGSAFGDGTVGLSFGAYAGDNARASHGVGAARLNGVELGNRSSFAERESYTTLHPELVARVVGRHALGEFSGSVAWDSDPTDTDFRTRATIDALFHTSSWTLWSALYAAATTSRPDSLGALGEISYTVSDAWSVGARYSWLDTSWALDALDVVDAPETTHEWTGSVRFDPTEDLTLQVEGNVISAPGETDFGGRVQLGFRL